MTAEAIERFNWKLISVSYKYCDPCGEASNEDKDIYASILHEFAFLCRDCDFKKTTQEFKFSKKYETKILYQLFSELELEIKELKYAKQETIVIICFQN